jgi:uncharacterized protein (DUF1800 family)
MMNTVWQPYQPSSQSPWDQRKVGHLYRRAGFGASWEEKQEALRLGPEKTIERLLAGGMGLADFEKHTDAMADVFARANNGPQLRAWWIYRMIYSPHPLKEKLTLFWHNHFATSNAKVQSAELMLGQYRLMYKHALGPFGTLLHDMSFDPAMLIWLDAKDSKKGNPNENYARELMELFSLGVGNYTEKDIREAARAFTGWEVKENKASFNAAQFDDGSKTVIGKTGRFKADDIVRICLDQPACPRFITKKVFRYLVSESIPATPELIDPLAEQFQKSGYDFGGLVRTILRSNLFFSPEAYRSSIKSPVEFAVGIVHGLDARPATTELTQSLEGLGQSLFYPPSVKGWDGGTDWLNGQTLLFRQNLALQLASTEGRSSGKMRPYAAVLLEKHGKRGDEEVVDFLLQLFLDGEASPDSRAKLVQYLKGVERKSLPVYWTPEDVADHRVRAVCHLVLTQPEFQLN